MHKHKYSHFMTYLKPKSKSWTERRRRQKQDTKKLKEREKKMLSDDEIWHNNYDRWLEERAKCFVVWTFIWSWHDRNMRIHNPVFPFSIHYYFQYWAHWTPKLFEYILFYFFNKNSFFYFIWFEVVKLVIICTAIEHRA